MRSNNEFQSTQVFLSALGAGAALGAGSRLWRSVPEGYQRRTRTAWRLGSNVSITLAHRRPDVLEDALNAAFTELQQVDAQLSLYRPDSQLSRLNRDGRLEHPHASLVTVLRESIELSRLNRRRFRCHRAAVVGSLRSS